MKIWDLVMKKNKLELLQKQMKKPLLLLLIRGLFCVLIVGDVIW